MNGDRLKCIIQSVQIEHYSDRAEVYRLLAYWIEYHKHRTKADISDLIDHMEF